MDGYSKEQEAVGNFICISWVNSDRTLRDLEDEVSALEFRVANYSPEFNKDFTRYFSEAIQEMDRLLKELEDKTKELENYRKDIWAKVIGSCDFSSLNQEICKSIVHFKLFR